MQKVLIVEDEIEQLQMLKNTIKDQYTDWDIYTATSFDEAMNFIKQSTETEKPFTLFLMDIQLSKEKGDRGGFILSEKIRTYEVYYKIPLLFLTAVSDEGRYALSHFHCYNYISKPYSPSDILLQLEQMLLTGYLENTLELKDTNRIRHKIFVNELLFAESKSHTITIHTAKEEYITRAYSLEQLLGILGAPFVRCHKRYIINSKMIRNYDKLTKSISINGILIPVGRAYAKMLDELNL